MRLVLTALLFATPGLAARTLHDMDVAVDATLHAGSPATVYVAVAGSTSFEARTAAVGARVVVSLGETEVARGVTDADGTYVGAFRVPGALRGSATLTVETESAHGGEQVARQVQIRSRRVLRLHTDRTIFAPGQTLHWRAAVMNAADAHPVSAAPLEVVLRDPRGTEIWRGRLETDATGWTAGAVPLGSDLVLGAYQIEARHDRWTERETVTVRRVEPPPFLVRLVPKGAGAFEVVARHPYGEPVEGRVRVVDGPQGVVDAFGRFAFESAATRLRVRVTDGAERTVEARWAAPGAGAPLRVGLIPERSLGARYVTVVTTRGDGLAPARITLTVNGHVSRRRSPGALRIPVRPGRVTVVARAEGEVARASHAVARSPRRWVRPSRALVVPGEPVAVRGRWPGGRALVVSLMRHDTPLASARVHVDRRGSFEARLETPAGVFGLAEIRVDETAWRAARHAVAASVFLEPDRVEVRLSAQTRHRPGGVAEVEVEVRDGAGRPAAGVGLAASVVDERSLALEPERPALLDILRAVDLSNAEAAGASFVDLLAREDGPGRVAARALVEALPASPAAFWMHHTAEGRWQAEARRMREIEAQAIEGLMSREAPVGRFVRGRWAYAMPLRELLPEAQRLTPWGRPTSWTYAVALNPNLRFSRVTKRLAARRLDTLAALLRAGTRLGAAPGHLRSDPWGHRVGLRGRSVDGTDLVDLVAAGPDGRFGSADDTVHADVFERDPSPVVAHGDAGLGMHGFGMGGGAVAYGGGSARISGPPPPIRKRFDETVLWLAGVPTDAAGNARLQVSLADSVTGWRVRVQALSPGGAVGTGETRLETFLPLQVDARVPAELTVADRYVVRAVVANHSGATRRLTVRAQTSGAIEGGATREIELPNGATSAVRVAVRATRAGAGTMSLALLEGGALVDRVERETRVVAPGHLVRLLNTGTVEAGRVAFDIELPADVTPGTLTGALRLYRGTLDQARDGLEGILREPHGCFEQTSSANYPNLMVLKLLEGEEGAQAAVEKARRFLAQGYQRLVSYEVEGGGFSWFGQAPANQVLTAYGLMQFVDMSAVYPVDPALVARTRAWLGSQQGEDGSWTPDPSWLHDWKAAQGKIATTAYIAWALAEAGDTGPTTQRALGFLRGHEGALAERPYLLALWAAAEAAAVGRTSASSAKATSIGPIERLRKRGVVTDGGLVFGAGGETLFYARGQAADAQVTALAIHALEGDGRRGDAADALRWLWSARSPHQGWGSTQGTVLALRAAAKMSSDGPSEGVVEVRVDGRPVGRLDLAAPGLPSVDLPELSPGPHRVEASGDIRGRLLADLRATWRKNGDPEPVREGLEVSLNGPAAPTPIGRTAKMKLVVRNPGATTIAMPTIVVPVPPGFKVSARSLSGLPVERHEDLGGVLHLYLAKLEPAQRLALDYALEATGEVEVTQRAARAYAYYDPAVQGLSEQLRLTTVDGPAPGPARK